MKSKRVTRCVARCCACGIRCTRNSGHPPTFHRNGRIQWPVNKKEMKQDAPRS